MRSTACAFTLVCHMRFASGVPVPKWQMHTCAAPPVPPVVCDGVVVAFIKRGMSQVRAALMAGSGAADTYDLAFQAAAAMEVVSDLCATPLFYHRRGAPCLCSSVCCTGMYVSGDNREWLAFLHLRLS